MWDAFHKDKIVSEEIKQKILKPYLHEVDNQETWYGLGLWMNVKNDEIIKYYFIGEDPGVTSYSAIFPKFNLTLSFLGNEVDATWNMVRAILKYTSTFVK